MNPGVFIEGPNDQRRRARLTFACLSEALVQGFNSHVGLRHHRDVVAMDELQPRHAPSWG